MDAAQAFLNANAAAQLAVLPHFSNKSTEDQFTPAQWLQKVISHKNAAQWTDLQTITHFRNALRGTSALNWFNSLEHLGVNVAVWADIKTRFEVDFKAAPTNSSVVFKIADIKQADSESVLDYFSRGIDTIKDLKSKIDPTRFTLADINLTAAQALNLAELTAETRAAFEAHLRTQVTKATLENVSSILITAGLKPEYRTDVLKRNLITIMEIRDAAMKCEELILEKTVKNIKTNGTPISEVADDDVNTVNYFNNNRGGFRGNNSNNRGYRGNNNRGNNRGAQNNQMSTQNSQNTQSTYRGGNNSQRGGRQNRGGRGGNNSQRGGRQNSSFMQGVFCEFCGKEGHREDKCYTKINCEKRKNQKLNPVSEENTEDQQSQHDQDDYEANEELSDIYNAHISGIFNAQQAKN
jgi:hypothetical protein